MSGVALRREVLQSLVEAASLWRDDGEAKWALWRRLRLALVLHRTKFFSEFAEFIKATVELIRQETDWRRTRKSN